MVERPRTIIVVCASLVALVTGLAGCATSTYFPDRAERLPRGYVYYLDGAGGGTALRNWADGVEKGMLAAGYKAAGEMYSWQTGLGIVTDQIASTRYKRAKAAELAALIGKYRREYPGAPVGIIAFSAGTAVAIFALEALPEGVQVDDVVLLAASVSADYDMTKALRHVRHRLYLFTSQRDLALGFLMPMTGTADRKFAVAAAGAKGFTLPADASAGTRMLYAQKLRTLPWTKKQEHDDGYGRHFDHVKMEFIRDHVAPLLMHSQAL